MLAALALAICLSQGHDIRWMDRTTSYLIPPGRYVCYRCGHLVEIKPTAAGGA